MQEELLRLTKHQPDFWNFLGLVKKWTFTGVLAINWQSCAMFAPRVSGLMDGKRHVLTLCLNLETSVYQYFLETDTCSGSWPDLEWVESWAIDPSLYIRSLNTGGQTDWTKENRDKAMCLVHLLCLQPALGRWICLWDLLRKQWIGYSAP